MGRCNYFLKRVVVVLKMVKTSFLEAKLQIYEIHLQQQMHNTSIDTLKNDHLVLNYPTLTIPTVFFKKSEGIIAIASARPSVRPSLRHANSS